MTLTAAILLMISAAAHACWNLLGKRGEPSPAFMLAANTFGILPLLPVAIAYWHSLAFFSPQIWLFLTLTGACQAIYYVGLAGAYRLGDLSIAYPLARSVPVVLVACVTAILRMGKPLSPQTFIGILIVTIGGFILPMRWFSDFRWRNYLNPSSLMALVAALGTTGYSIIDSEALRILRLATAQQISAALVTIVYAFWEGLLSSAWLGLLVMMNQVERQVSRLRDADLWRAALAGLGSCAGYTLVLIAMGYVSNVSYVVAFRQLSIPLGTLLGALILKEPHPLPKVVGVAAIFAGLVLVGTG